MFVISLSVSYVQSRVSQVGMSALTASAFPATSAAMVFATVMTATMNEAVSGLISQEHQKRNR